MANTNLLQAAGLQTFNNNLDLPAGSLVQAENVIIDRNGVIEPRRGFKQWKTVGSDISLYAYQLISYKDKILAHYPATGGSKLSFDSGSNSLQNFDGIYEPVESGVRIKSVELNGNLYFTSSEGIKKISAKNSADLNSVKIIDAGGVRALDIELQLSTSGASFLPANSQVGYRVVWGVKDNNSNLILGYPSPLNVISNFGSQSVSTKIKFYVPDEINPSDSSKHSYFYQIYRSQIYSNDVTVSDELKLVYEGFNDGATNWVSDHYEITDNYPDTLREANTNLYTNQYSGEGIAYGNLKPPVSLDITTYKNHVFYGNVKSKHQLTNTLLGTSEFSFFNVSSITGTTTKTITIGTHNILENQEICLRGTSLFDGFYVATNVTATGFDLVFGSDPDATNSMILGKAVVYSTNLSITKGITVNYYWPVGRQQEDTVEFNTAFSQQITKFEFNSATKTDYADEKFIIYDTNNKNAYGIWFDTTGSSLEPAFTTSIPSGTVFTKIKVPLYSATLTTLPQIVQQTRDQLLLTLSTTFEIEYIDSNPNYYLQFTTLQNGTANAAVIETGTNIAKTSETLGVGASVYSDEKITIYSAENKIKYLIWFMNTENAIAPIDTTASVIAIDFTDTALTTTEEICNKFIEEMNNKIPDFTCQVGSSSNITSIKTSSSGSATTSSLSGNGDLTLTNITKGIGLINSSGETVNKKYFLLSTYESSSLKNEETVKSLLNAINKNSNDVVYGYYTSVSTGLPGEFNLESRIFDGTSFVVSSNDNEVKSNIFNETLPQTSNSESLPNRLFFSKPSEPDSVPLVNYFDVGPRDKAIRRIVGLRDSLFIFKEEGIYRLFGNISNNFQVVLFDSSSNISATDSVAVLNNQIYLLTSQGVGRVSETGVNIISRPIENLFTRVSNINYYQWSTFGIGYEADRSYLLFTPFEEDDITATKAFRFNTFTETWTTWNRNYNCGIVHPGENKLYFGAVEDNYIEVERKTLSRKDYADRQYSGKNIVAKVNDTKITLSNNQNLDIGDSLVQTQTLTIAQINRLINKIKTDSFLTAGGDITIEEAVPYDDLSVKLKEIVDILNEKDTTLKTLNPVIILSGSVISYTNHGLEEGDYVKATASTVSEITPNVYYRVANVINSNQFELETVNGSLITFASGGSISNLNEQYYASQSNVFSQLQIEFNLIISKLNNSSGVFYANYQISEGTIEYEAHITYFSVLNNQILIDNATAFIVGECENHKGIVASFTYSPQHFGDPSIWKHVREAKIMFESDNFEGAYLGFNTDLANDFEEILFKMEGDGSWGNVAWGSFTWGGEGLQVPFRTLIPRQKQRCRFIKARFRHANARNKFAIYGLSYTFEGGTERSNK